MARSALRPSGCVALRKESVDRNRNVHLKNRVAAVALRKESVDRNDLGAHGEHVLLKSLSARRAWIEISIRKRTPAKPFSVALRKESVDRNYRSWPKQSTHHSRSPQGERG